MKEEKSIHFACIKTKKGKLLAIASNNEYKHAEVNVIEKVIKNHSKKELSKMCKKGGGFVLEVVRMDKKNKGSFTLSKPCEGCQKRINKCPGIIKIFHS